jgi:hypothetical protein
MRPYETPPLLTREGGVSTSGYAPAEPLAPGSLVSLFGLRLSNFQETFQQLPLPQRLGDTENSAQRPPPTVVACHGPAD